MNKLLAFLAAGVGLTFALGAKASTKPAPGMPPTPPKPPTGDPPLPPKPPSKPPQTRPVGYYQGDGLEWARSLPQSAPMVSIQDEILKQIQAGNGNIEWGVLALENKKLPGYLLQLTVTRRVVRIGEKNPVRVCVDYLSQQTMADMLSAALCTPRVLQAVWQVGRKLPVLGMANQWGGPPGDDSMGLVKRMVDYSILDDERIGSAPYTFLMNEGKHWVIAKRLWSDPVSGKGWDLQANRADPWGANYGWFKPDGSPIQTVGLAHNMRHADYSQQAFFMKTACVLNGIPCHVGQILADPKFHVLLSDEGVLPSWAHPAFQKPPLPPLPSIPPTGGILV